MSWLNKALQDLCLDTVLMTPFSFVAAPSYRVPVAGHGGPWLMVLDVQSSHEETPLVKQQNKDWSGILQLPVLGTIKESSISQSENVSASILGVGNVKRCHPS